MSYEPEQKKSSILSRKLIFELRRPEPITPIDGPILGKKSLMKISRFDQENQNLYLFKRNST